jgi:hypothetical protein
MLFKRGFPQAEVVSALGICGILFKKYFHDMFGRFWPTARAAYMSDEYQHHMAKVFAASEKVYPYLRVTRICYG